MLNPISRYFENPQVQFVYMSESRLVLIEDDPFVRRHIATLIEAAPDMRLTGEAGSVAEGLSLLDTAPDLIVLDLGLSDGSGLEIIKAARQRGLPTRILILTVFGDETSVISALTAGADGYVLKDSAESELIGSIRHTLNGGSPISAPVAAYLLRHIRKDASLAVVAEPELAEDAPGITPREIELLSLLAKGLSYKEAASVLDISHHTVGTHVKAIYRKLAVNSRSEAVFEAVRSGLIRM